MDNIRFLLIVTFAMLVFMLEQAWQADYGPKPAIQTVVENINTHDDLPAGSKAIQSPVSIPVADITTAKVIKITTDVFALEINTEGGTIQNLDLLAYPVEHENTAVNKLREMFGFERPEINKTSVRIFNGEANKLFVAQSGLMTNAGSVEAANHHSIFVAPQNNYALAVGQEHLVVPLTWTDANGLTVTKTFTFERGSYEIDMAQNVKNGSQAVWTGRQYSQLLKTPETENKGGMLTSGMRAYDGAVIYTEAKKYQKIDFDDMHDDNLDIANIGGWTAMIQHYFASAWVPPADQENHFYSKELKLGQYVIGNYSPAITIDVNAEANFAAKLFAGPKIQPMMEKTAAGLELTVDYSVLTFIGKPIYWLLNQIHGLIGNWGLSIIGVTFVIKLFFFPLSHASFKSMAKMRKIQPRLKELQDRFKDDRPRFNTEMMAMYKKEKVNPLGGCLPILIQIPVFMALYWVLSETVEFRQAPFMLWIQDLSIQDPFFVLPVIMGISMKIQQSLNPAPIDPVQAKIIKMFPIVFTVFFLFFPAGLVLYWVINNTLSILQQTYITRQIENAK
ncbi:membrane protein insertase YidC [Methylococcaceae bacterium]|nr:membrane protein insertase YidC [Methylococcaceae bacterium]